MASEKEKNTKNKAKTNPQQKQQGKGDNPGTGAGSSKSPETVMRMNYLYQAANLVQKPPRSSSRRTGGPLHQIVAASYAHLFLGIGKKSVIRSDREVKRSLCKGCHGLLQPGISCEAKLRGKKKKNGRKLEFICGHCHTAKSFLLKKKDAP